MNEKTLDVNLSRLSHLMSIDPFLSHEVQSIQQRQFTEQLIDLSLYDIENTGELIHAAMLVFNLYRKDCERTKPMAYVRDCLFMTIYRIFHEESPDLNIISTTNPFLKGSLVTFSHSLYFKSQMINKIIEHIKNVPEQQGRVLKLGSISEIKNRLHLSLKKMRLDDNLKIKLIKGVEECNSIFYTMHLLEKIYKYLQYTDEFNKVNKRDREYFLKLMLDLIFSQKRSDLISCLNNYLDFFDFPDLNMIPDMMKYLMKELPNKPLKRISFKFFREKREEDCEKVRLLNACQ